MGAFPQINPLIIQNLLNNNFMNLGRMPQVIRQPNVNRLNVIRQSINDPVARAFLGRIPSNMMVHDSIVGTTVPDLENKFTEFMQNRNNNNNNNNVNNNENNNVNNNENNNENNNNNINPEQFNPQNFLNFLNMLRPNQPPPNFNIRISRPLQTNNNNNNNEQNSQNQTENIDYKEIYKEQLAQLKDMGFTDESKNIEILKQCQGNINFAIEKLFGGGT